MIIILIIAVTLLAALCVALFLRQKEYVRTADNVRGELEHERETGRQFAARAESLQQQYAAFQNETVRREAAMREDAVQRETSIRESASRRENELRGELSGVSARLAAAEAKLEAATRQLEAKDTQLAESRRQTEVLLRQQEERFKNLANEILEANTRRFNDASSQKINDLLNPLKENIESFRKDVGDAYNNESRERFSLQKEIRDLLELNRTIGREARDLTRALRADSKMQGDWGEMILEQLLEKSGLQKGVHFDMQVTRDVDGTKLESNDGRSLRADVVIYYPDDRCLVIDSKVSLTAFIDYVNLADDPDDPDGSRRSEAAGRHLASVKSHINELARKNYQDLIGKKRMDFVMMFVPNEAAYIAAMQIEPALWQEAYDKRVLLVSPTQLISVLRMLRQLWKQDAVNRNVEEIARLSGRMLDKFVGVMESFDDLDKHIGNTQRAYQTLRNRLSEGNGNVFVTARKIQELGAKSTKQLPEK